MAGMTRSHVVALNPSRLHGVRLDGTHYGFHRASRSRREDPSLRLQRDLGRALWFAFGIVVLWIHAN